MGRNDEPLVFDMRGAYISREIVLMVRKKTSLRDSLTWEIDKRAQLSWAKIVLYHRLLPTIYSDSDISDYCSNNHNNQRLQHSSSQYSKSNSYVVLHTAFLFRRSALTSKLELIEISCFSLHCTPKRLYMRIGTVAVVYLFPKAFPKFKSCITGLVPSDPKCPSQ